MKTILLTYPQVMSRHSTESPFGHGDFGPRGFEMFIGSHRCGATCVALELEEKFDELLLELELRSNPHFDASRSQCPVSPGRRRRYHRSKASTEVRNQQGGTCYAHAVATILRAAESRIIGRQCEPHSEKLARIVANYGAEGGDPRDVLASECPRVSLSWREVSIQEAVDIIRKRQRPLLVSFCLAQNQWVAFSDFFERDPKGVLSELPQPPIFARLPGHACVITELQADSVWVIKNSWGGQFADNGSFKVSKSLLTECGSIFIDVYFLDHDLQDDDRRSYEAHISQLINKGLYSLDTVRE